MLLLAGTLPVAAASFGQGKARPAKVPPTIPVWIRSVGQYPPKPSTTPGNVVRQYFLQLYNPGPKEIATLDVRYRVAQEGKPLFSSAPVRIAKFNDYAFHNTGGIVPGIRSFSLDPIPMDVPEKWEAEADGWFEIVGVTYHEGKTDLHDLGHLYTWLLTAQDEQVEAKLKADPSLASSTNEMSFSALAVAYMGGSKRAIEAFLKANRFGTPSFPMDQSAMHMAAYNPRSEALDVALAQGASPNDKAKMDQTPLMTAIVAQRIENVRWLLRHGADPSQVDGNGSTPLTFAIAFSPSETVKLLVSGGARLKVYDAQGYGPLHTAAIQRNYVPNTMAALVHGGLAADDHDVKSGVTPLMAAAKVGNYAAARWLVQRGAKLDAKDAKGKSVYDYAREAGSDGEAAFRREVVERKS